MSYRSIIPPSTSRVKRNTKEKINRKIERKTMERIKKYQSASKDELIKRLKQLNREWDTERILEANASAIILISSIIRYKKHSNWYLATGTISFFLLLHAIEGWCPPLPVIRYLGVRTPEEIYNEKSIIESLIDD